MKARIFLLTIISVAAVGACTTNNADAQDKANNSIAKAAQKNDLKIFLNSNEIGPLTATAALEKELVRIGSSRNDEGLYRDAPKDEDTEGLVAPSQLEYDVWMFPDDKVSALEFARIYKLTDENVLNVYLRRNSGIDPNRKIAPQPLFLALTLGTKTLPEPLNLPSYDEKREYSTTFQPYIEEDPILIQVMRLVTNAIEIDSNGELWIYEAYDLKDVSDDWRKNPVKSKKIEWAKLGDEIVTLMRKNPATLKNRLPIIVEKDIDYGQIRRIVAVAEEKVQKLHVELNVINR